MARSKIYTKTDMSLQDFKEYLTKTYTGKYKDKYTFDENDWIDKDTPILMHCKIHGVFYRSPWEFGQGFVCPFEHNALRNHPEFQGRAFAEKGKKKFGDRFVYHPEEYITCKENTRITCIEHGDFYTTPDNHLTTLDGGCEECNKIRMHKHFVKPVDQFIEDSKAIWGEDAFDYSKAEYINRWSYVTLICKKHNLEFKQVAYKHLNHHDQCPKCLEAANRERNLMEMSEFLNRAKAMHGDKYDYSKTDTKNRNEDGKVCIICHEKYADGTEHGEFWQDPISHINGYGCQKCGKQLSVAENDIIAYIQENLPNTEVIHGKFGIIGRKQLDIYIPSRKVAIEYNGLHWHTEEFTRDKNYHLEKLENCNKNGIKLIHIFEDEWLEHKEIVLRKIAHILKFNEFDKIIRGHKCQIIEIPQDIAKSFFESNHIQGYVRGSVILGAFYEHELIGACIFKKEAKEGYWELTRMTTKINYLCHGVCGKMFKYFVKNYNPVEIKSFADRRWTANKESNLYTALGFTLEKVLNPDYRYVIGNKRIHKFNFRKQILHKKYGLPLTMTEKEMTKQLGFYRIWDCGLFKYIWYGIINN